MCALAPRHGTCLRVSLYVDMLQYTVFFSRQVVMFALYSNNFGLFQQGKRPKSVGYTSQSGPCSLCRKPGAWEGPSAPEGPRWAALHGEHRLGSEHSERRTAFLILTNFFLVSFQC